MRTAKSQARRAPEPEELGLQLRDDLTEIREFYTWENLEIRTEADQVAATEGLAAIADRLKEIKRFRLSVVGPIKQGVRAFEERCREVTEPLERIDRGLRRKIGVFWDARQREEEEKARAEREAAAKEARRKALEAAEAALETGSETAAKTAENFERQAERFEERPAKVRQTIRTSDRTLAQVIEWKWKVLDIGKVPREYLVIDEKKLNALCRGAKAQPADIPGVEFFTQSRPQLQR